MTLPNTPSQAPQADDSPLGRDIFAAVKYGIYSCERGWVRAAWSSSSRL